jgi:outer membrane receptor protein involved in Fe transport
MKRILYLSFVLAAMFVVVGPVWAQITAGTRGTITDPTGSVVPNAIVTIVNEQTHLTHKTTTSSSGIYGFTLLPVGNYTLRVQAGGFRAYERTGIVLTVAEVLGLDVTLALGAITEKVVVSGGASLVNTQTTEVGNLEGTREISDLPLNTRNPIQLATLTTGITNAGIAFTMAGPPDPRSGATGQASEMSVNGSRTIQGEYLLDGTEFSLPAENLGPNYPNPDALEEFRFITSNYSAEYGKNAGGVMDVITKSGTNQYHGAAWEFNRNSDLASRNFFLPTVAPLNQNQYGASFGGRILKNKLFAFGTYQGLCIAQGRTSSTEIPITATEIQGNLANNSLNQHPKSIVDPTHPLTTDPLHYFAGNIIPTNRIDHVATVYQTLHPEANSSNGYWLGSASEPLTNYQWMPKVDWNVSDKQRASFSYFRDHSTSSSLLDFGRLRMPFLSPPATGDIPRHTFNDTKDFIFSYVYSFRPNLLNQFRFAYVYFDWDLINNGRHPTLVDMGATFPNFGVGADIPQIAISGRINDSGGNFQLGHSPDYEFGDNVNYIRGIHSVKMGLEIRYREDVNTATGNGEGAFTLNGSVTGDAVGDYLLGTASSFAASTANALDATQPSLGAYIQDDIKLTRRLTLNAGVRFDHYSPWNFKRNVQTTDGKWVTRGSNFYIDRFYADQISTVFPTATPGMVYPGDPGVPTSLFPTQSKWEPRLGVAWDVTGDGKTSLRGGAGFFTVTLDGDTAGNGVYSPPFYMNYSVASTPSMMNAMSAATLAAFPPSIGPSLNLTPMYGAMLIEGISPNMRNGSVYEWNLTLQRQLPGKLSLQVGYVGNVSHHLMDAWDEDKGVYIPGNNPATGLPYSTTGNVITRKRLSLAGPQAPNGGPFYSRVSALEPVGNGNYHSLQVQARKEFSHGLSSLTSFTFGKSIDDDTVILGSALNAELTMENPDCIRCERSRSLNDQRFSFIESFVYNTPDISERLFKTNNRGARYLTDGWEVGGIAILASGFPFTVTDGVDQSRTGMNADRPNQIGDPRIHSWPNKAAYLNEFFNTAAFALQAVGTYGTLGRATMTGPANHNVDFDVIKNFPISERLGKIQLRFESFNFLNHANFNFTMPTGGGVSQSVSTATTFGKLTTAGSPRIIQIGAKWTF